MRRTTNRVVLDPQQAALDPGLLVTGELQRFGYDAATGQVIVQYDGALSTAGGTRVETRRFTATAPADGTAATRRSGAQPGRQPGRAPKSPSGSAAERR